MGIPRLFAFYIWMIEVERHSFNVRLDIVILIYAVWIRRYEYLILIVTVHRTISLFMLSPNVGILADKADIQISIIPEHLGRRSFLFSLGPTGKLKLP